MHVCVCNDNGVRMQIYKCDSIREDSDEYDSTGGGLGEETLRDDSRWRQ